MFRENAHLKIIIIGLLSLFLIACGNNEDDTTQDASDNMNDAESTEATTQEDSTEEDTVDSDAESNADENNAVEIQELEIPTIFPDDMPVPDDAEQLASKDEEDHGVLAINTQQSIEELEEAFDKFFEDRVSSEDEFVKHPWEEPENAQAITEYEHFTDEVEIMISIEDHSTERFIKITYIEF